MKSAPINAKESFDERRLRQQANLSEIAKEVLLNVTQVKDIEKNELDGFLFKYKNYAMAIANIGGEGYSFTLFPRWPKDAGLDALKRALHGENNRDIASAHLYEAHLGGRLLYELLNAIEAAHTDFDSIANDILNTK